LQLFKLVEAKKLIGIFEKGANGIDIQADSFHSYPDTLKNNNGFKTKNIGFNLYRSQIATQRIKKVAKSVKWK